MCEVTVPGRYCHERAGTTCSFAHSAIEYFTAYSEPKDGDCTVVQLLVCLSVADQDAARYISADFAAMNMISILLLHLSSAVDIRLKRDCFKPNII